MEQLGIDPKLLFSQVVNFLILYFLLNKLLYKPVLKLLEERKKAVEKTQENLKKSQELLEKAQEDQKEMLRQATKQVNEILLVGQKAGKEQSEEIVENARKEGQRIITNAQQQSDQLADEVLKIVQKRAGKMVIDVTQNVLRDLDAETQHKLVQGILKKLD